jgi:predicted GIY-YIG superfamily endonuclease
MTGEPTGTVYLLHLERPLAHAQHYMGFSTNLPSRLKVHRSGNVHSSAFMREVKRQGIRWSLARTWPGTRDTERQLKDRHEGRRLCPTCCPPRVRRRVETVPLWGAS